MTEARSAALSGPGTGRKSVREEQRLLTQRRIMDSAIKVFDEKGYADTTVEDIVSVAGIARGTFYLHFKNKLAIVRAIGAESNDEIATLYRALDILVTSGDMDDPVRMREWMSRALDWFAENRTIAIVSQEMSLREPEYRLTSGFFIVDQMQRYVAQWPEGDREAARLRIILLVQQLARAFLLVEVRHALPVERSVLIDVLSDIWSQTLKPPYVAVSNRTEVGGGGKAQAPSPM